MTHPGCDCGHVRCRVGPFVEYLKLWRMLARFRVFAMAMGTWFVRQPLLTYRAMFVDSYCCRPQLRLQLSINSGVVQMGASTAGVKATRATGTLDA